MTNELRMSMALVAASACLSLGTMAQAGGMSEPVVTPAPAPVPVAPTPIARGNDWTGFYAGGQLGYGRLLADPLTEDPDGITFGVHAGYLYDLGNAVIGGELELDGTNIEDETADVALDSVTRAKFRVGYDAGNWMPYLAGGIAQASTSGAVEGTDTGAFGGIGIDYLLSDTIRVGGEVLQHQFEDFDGNGFDIDATTLSARVSFAF